MKQRLTQLGLSEEESELYLALLEFGGAHASRLAKRLGRNRTTIYHTLSNLIEKGLASRTDKGSYQYFSAEPPEKLVQTSRQRFALSEALLPELLSIQNSKATKPKIAFFDRTKDIEAIFEDSLNARGEILGYTNLSLLAELLPGYFQRYTKERLKRRLRVRYLSPRPSEGTQILVDLFPSGIDASLLEIIFINPEEFLLQNEIAIYGNKVALMSLSKDESMAVLLESETVAKSMRSIFDLAWIGAGAFVAQ